MIVASVSSIPRPGADLRPDPSSHARTGPTTKTRWTTAPTSRRRASPSARSSSTRTRLARPGSRRTPRARRTALGSTLTCGAASITAWRPSCSRTRSEGRHVVGLGLNPRPSSFNCIHYPSIKRRRRALQQFSKSSCVHPSARPSIQKRFHFFHACQIPINHIPSLFDFFVTICSTGGGKPPRKCGV